MSEIATSIHIKGGKYVTFSLGKEEYAISIQNVPGIVKFQKITELPNTPHYVIGVINLRGKIIPVFDLRLRFGLERAEYDSFTVIIITEIQKKTMGIIVDKVNDVITLRQDEIMSADNFNSTVTSEYISSIGKIGNDKLLIILNIEKILTTTDMNIISESIKSEYMKAEVKRK
jgi:purine-binding chemotaxis protein CheW